MGAIQGKPSKNKPKNVQKVETKQDNKDPTGFKAIADNFKTFDQLEQGLLKCGLEVSNLIVGFDFTRSNWQNGKKSRHGKSLHYLPQNEQERRTNPNHYEMSFSIVARTLRSFDADHIIPAYMFGDSVTTSKSVRPLRSDGNAECKELEGVLTAYRAAAAAIQPVDDRLDLLKPLNPDKFEIELLGPTCFAPMIYEAIRIVQENNHSYHILMILTDGQVVNEDVTAAAIIEASNYPISIVIIGVGDADFSKMREFDDLLTARKFDNLQFVNYTEFFGTMRDLENPDLTFATKVMMEIPEQYHEIRKRKLIGTKFKPSAPSAPSADIFQTNDFQKGPPGGPLADAPPSYDQSVKFHNI